MELFMTGATGYIGSVVAETFLAGGARIVGLARSEEKAEALRRAGVRPVSGGLADAERLAWEARHADGVVHLAISHTDNERLDTLAVRSMLEALEGSGKPFLYTSGTLIYDDTGETAVDEDAALRPPPFLAWKAEQERAVLAAASRDVRTAVLRPTLVYGRGGGLVRGQIELVRRLGAARYVGDGTQAWSTIHVDDVAKLYLRAYERAKPGALYNLASREAVTMKALVYTVARLAGLEREVASWTYAEAEAALGPLAWPMSISQRVSGAKAERELAWTPRASSLLEELAEGSYAV